MITTLLILLFFFSDSEKYDYVGKLLRPGEEPTNYSEEEEEVTNSPDGEKEKPKSE